MQGSRSRSARKGFWPAESTDVCHSRSGGRGHEGWSRAGRAPRPKSLLLSRVGPALPTRSLLFR
eukprot:10694114-Alexandrium_andersonii.AAC.1